ncbi:hypothetical protein Dsin_023594 [Dipteronia sinensis]|uniref:NB-ARC domain-containing protein n=1 Tax=Dipteronia sinensis TaxID=43782 RepID=A0AAE0A3V1_9ROSI|nr:hypothetical protein Dsin_023594 [Dipteronia sinensis]
MGNWDSYRDDLDALKTESDNLIQTRNDVMKKIAEEEEQPMKPTNELQLWLSRVQAVETDVDELIRGAYEELEKLHPGGMNISMSSSSYYELEDMVADKLEAVTNLIKEGAFLVADEAPVVTTLIDEGGPEVAVAETIPAEEVADDQLPIVGMESIFKKVWTCLKKGGEEEDDEVGRGGGDDDDYDFDFDEEEDDDDNDDVGIIGVYGMGGVGKTTLLKQINKKLDLEMKNDFDVVIWVVVSRDLQLDKIHQQIGEKIGLFDNKVWKHKNFEEKSSDIFKILKEKKFVLLMDDLWERVDLTKVGVPLPSPENSSKIVFTTRSLQICSLMEADKQFKVKCLGYIEAWKLFKALVGDETLQSHPEVFELAIGVCRECCGLPLALVSIGRAMVSKKTPQEWSDVFKVLRRSTTSYSGSDDQLKKDIHYNLKLSYDNLQNDKFKSCFLYCCLFPRYWEIKKKDLIDYWIGEGFLDDRLGAVQSQGHYIIDVLLSVCLLEKHGNGYVKMQYWIHDMSLWIAKLMGNVIPFSKLNTIALQNLPKLRSIYWTDLPFPDLKKTTICECPKLPVPPRLLIFSVASWSQIQWPSITAMQSPPRKPTIGKLDIKKKNEDADEDSGRAIKKSFSVSIDKEIEKERKKQKEGEMPLLPPLNTFLQGK